MPRLTFIQLTKVFAAGFLGYALLIAVLSFGTALLFPSYIKSGWIDMSIHEFLKTVFFWFGVFGVIATPLMLFGAWCILRWFRRRVEHDNAPSHAPPGSASARATAGRRSCNRRAPIVWRAVALARRIAAVFVGHYDGPRSVGP